MDDWKRWVTWANNPPKPTEEPFGIRWICYARAHGKTPAQMEKHDREAAPKPAFEAPNLTDCAWLKPHGAWVSPLWTEFMETVSGVPESERHSVQYRDVHDRFDAWLILRVEETKEPT